MMQRLFVAHALRIAATLCMAATMFCSGCGGPQELPQDEASKEQRRQKEMEMMHREMSNQ